MIYGYCGDKVNEHGLFEMKEISFSMSTEGLRAVSNFLNSVADEIDSGQFSDTSHQHIANVLPDWKEICPNHDIIVLKREN